MRVCPNPACPFRRKFHHPAEYEAHAQVCSDCGTQLVEASEIAEEAIARPFEQYAPASAQQDLGEPAGLPIPVVAEPQRSPLPLIALAAGAFAIVHAVVTSRSNPSLVPELAIGGACVAFGLFRLAWRRARRIEPHASGFILEASGRRIAVPFDGLQQVRVHARELRGRSGRYGYSVELSFQLEGATWFIASFARERGEAFEEWARRVSFTVPA